MHLTPASSLPWWIRRSNTTIVLVEGLHLRQALALSVELWCLFMYTQTICCKYIYFHLWWEHYQFPNFNKKLQEIRTGLVCPILGTTMGKYVYVRGKRNLRHVCMGKDGDNCNYNRNWIASSVWSATQKKQERLPPCLVSLPYTAVRARSSAVEAGNALKYSANGLMTTSNNFITIKLF